ncbi:RNA polymerase sigma factor [Chitinophaga sp. sic0106]|uniref:RNA polymerase sigma factor n=1 Tax=Chitinophaga sp. sic0106 TaxID=2854785 RepID=UPI001C448FF6|nr:sigma-70 family RNA polymerase sigma factor [Chitinophaga sp. sic0106]MBV7529609.1 sigma-70 family RNA polymerase sigma factor [Chitinophaga sp. sic0106]
MQESEYWESFKSGEVNGLEALYGQYYQSLANYGCKFTHDDVCIEESIQDLFRRLWQNREWVHHATAVKQYLYHSFRRILLGKLDYGADAYNEAPDEQVPFELQLKDEHPLFSGERMSALLHRAQHLLGSMAHRQREILFLRYYEGLSHDEVAEVMNMHITGVSRLMYRTLDHLRNKACNFSLLTLLYLLRQS